MAAADGMAADLGLPAVPAVVGARRVELRLRHLRGADGGADAQAGPIRVPPGFGIWMVLLLWVFLSVLTSTSPRRTRCHPAAAASTSAGASGSPTTSP
ncbi:hypothetical protein V2I01_12685 [Micromonospora sp. BRA006-A]|nr:hypothetical protein [Micromonospora sp. BRA006-A]